MAYQTARQIEVVYKVEETFGTAPAATGADGFRANTGGLNLTKDPIQSNENRRDGQTTRGRHGSRNVSGNYTGDLSVGTFDDLIEALFWGTFDSAVSIDDETAAMSSATIAIASNVVTSSAGSFITAGLRVGDVIRSTEGFHADDLNANIRIVGLTATTITCLRADGEDLTDVAGPVSAYTITRAKKVIQSTTRRSFTFEERESDIDGSELFTGCRIGSMALEMQPNGMATVNFGIVGQNMTTKTGAESPFFTTPTYTTTQGLTAVEAKIMLGSTEIVDLTGVTLNFDRRAAGNPVVGSVVTPDVFDNTLQITGSISGLRQDLTRTAAFLAETDLSLHLLFAENTAEPAAFISLFIPYLSLASSSKSELGQDGPRTQTLDLMIGKDERGGAYEAAMAVYQTSAT